jgi:hypothetical protein
MIVRKPKKCYGKEEQIAYIEQHIHYLEKLIEYLKEGKIAEIVHELYRPRLVKYATQKFYRQDELGEEFILFVENKLIDRLSRGIPAYYFGSRFDSLFREFFSKKALMEGIKTVEFNESVNYKNEAI